MTGSPHSGGNWKQRWRGAILLGISEGLAPPNSHARLITGRASVASRSLGAQNWVVPVPAFARTFSVPIPRL
mgnify:CR=1 FL=1